MLGRLRAGTSEPGRLPARLRMISVHSCTFNLGPYDTCLSSTGYSHKCRIPHRLRLPHYLRLHSQMMSLLFCQDIAYTTMARHVNSWCCRSCWIAGHVVMFVTFIVSWFSAFFLRMRGTACKEPWHSITWLHVHRVFGPRLLGSEVTMQPVGMQCHTRRLRGWS